MAITFHNTRPTPSDQGEDVPQTPMDRTKQKRELEKTKKDLKEIQKNKKEIEKTVKEIDKLTDKTVNSFVCALRLDMVADQLEKINSKWAHELDLIANEVEKAEWE